MTTNEKLGQAERAAGPATTMRAMVQNIYGSADVLRLAQIDRPVPAAGEVLVQVVAAGLDRGTWHLMTGTPYLMRLVCGLRGPRNPVLGRDVAGTVVAVGSEVTRFVIGDEVYGMGSGSFAEYVVVREAKIAHKPANLTFEQAAAVPISAGTALQALDAGHIQPGQRVLITGASGGVGSFAVQLAKGLGAEVTGVCSTGKVDLVRSLGADHVVDYTLTDFSTGGQRYDLIIDIAGNSPLSRLRRVLTATGTLVIVGAENAGKLTGMSRQLRAPVVSLFVSQRLTSLVSREHSGVLVRLTQLIESGTVVPSIDRIYPLAEVPAAMRHLAAGNVLGKVAISI